MSRRWKTRVGLLAVLALAAVVRLAGLAWGLPDETHFFSYHPDEFMIAGAAQGMVSTGTLNPGNFNYGSLTIYLTCLLLWPLHVAGAVKTVAGAHVVARLVTWAFGVGTVWASYRLGGRVLNARGGLWAALLVALMPGHVLHSGFATVDVPATFFVATTLLFAVRFLESGERKMLLLAAVAAGFAAATKYNAGLVLLAPLTAVLLRRREKRRPREPRSGAAIGWCLVAAAAAFLLAMPYVVLDFPSLWRDFSYELLEHPRAGHLNIFTETGNGWWYHLTVNLPYTLGIPLLLVALAGFAVMVRERRAVDWVLLAFALPYFATLGLSLVRFQRYTLPLAPVCAIAAIRFLGMDWVQGRLERGRRRAIGRVLLALVIVSLVILTGRQQLEFARTDPRERARAWLERHAGVGASIGLLHVPWFYTPPVSLWNGGEQTRRQFEASRAGPQRFRLVLCEDWSVDALLRERPDLLLVSEFEWREERRLGDRRALAFLREIDAQYDRVARFDAIPPSQRRLFGRAFAPHDWLYPFATVEIQRRR
jgi:4-amino-4-deoxy-L-arabinose transferase-like glycosyltransferase